MAKQVQTILIDDIDGSAAQETVTFSLDGANYEIDLNEEHAAALRESFAEWTAKARRVGRSTGRRRTAAPAGDSRKIREWAKEQGMSVPERGRIPQSVREAYEAAN